MYSRTYRFCYIVKRELPTLARVKFDVRYGAVRITEQLLFQEA